MGEYTTKFENAGYVTVGAIAALDEDTLETLAEDTIKMARSHRKIFYPWAKGLPTGAPLGPELERLGLGEYTS